MSKVSLSEFIISVVELVDAQFEQMKGSLVNSAKGIILIVVSSLLLFVAFLFLLIGFRVWIELYTGLIGSYFATSLLATVLSLILLWIASWTIKKR